MVSNAPLASIQRCRSSFTWFPSRARHMMSKARIAVPSIMNTGAVSCDACDPADTFDQASFNSPPTSLPTVRCSVLGSALSHRSSAVTACRGTGGATQNAAVPNQMCRSSEQRQADHVSIHIRSRGTYLQTRLFQIPPQRPDLSIVNGARLSDCDRQPPLPEPTKPVGYQNTSNRM
jgi:hypothetical protein